MSIRWVRGPRTAKTVDVEGTDGKFVWDLNVQKTAPMM